MKFTPRRINLFTFLKLPSVWWTGVRVKRINQDACEVCVRHQWINQNPFNSLFWAVQGMAAELATGVLLMQAIAECKRNISMLVLNNKATFSKKGTGRVTFLCTQGEQVSERIKQAVETGEPQKVWLESKGIDEAGDEVSTFYFEWTLLVKK